MALAEDDRRISAAPVRDRRISVAVVRDGPRISQVAHQLTFPFVGSTFSGVPTTVFRKQVPVTLLPQTLRPDFRLMGRLHQKVDLTPFLCIGQPSQISNNGCH